MKGLQEHSGIYFLSVGRGAFPQGLGNRAIAVEYLKDELSMSLLYSAADIFAVPSLQDNFPNTALEALSCGVPVVAFAAGGLPEIVREGVTGALVPVGDVQALRGAISRLLEEPDQRARMSEECRRIAVTDYTLEVQAKRYVSLYEEALKLQKQRAITGNGGA
jgi:glycosyltransferase involved in cell wall biosynthesis